MRIKEVKVLFEDGYEVNDPMDSYYLFQMIGESALCYIETFPDKVRDRYIMPVFRLEDHEQI